MALSAYSTQWRSDSLARIDTSAPEEPMKRREFITLLSAALPARFPTNAALGSAIVEGKAVPTLPLKAERPHARSRRILSKTTEVIDLLFFFAPESFSWV
jgi:hypothetical protein